MISSGVCVLGVGVAATGVGVFSAPGVLDRVGVLPEPVVLPEVDAAVLGAVVGAAVVGVAVLPGLGVFVGFGVLPEAVAAVLGAVVGACVLPELEVIPGVGVALPGAVSVPGVAVLGEEPGAAVALVSAVAVSPGVPSEEGAVLSARISPVGSVCVCAASGELPPGPPVCSGPAQREINSRITISNKTAPAHIKMSRIFCFVQKGAFFSITAFSSNSFMQ